MFHTIKSLILSVLFVFLLAPVVHAQANNLDTISNIGRVLLFQFDITDIIEDFKVDVYLNTNACKQVDLLNIFSAQDDITNTLLNNYSQIDQTQRNQLVTRYQSLEIEIAFLKTIDVLIEDGYIDGKNNHKNAVLSRISSNLTNLVDSLYESLHLKYEDRIRIFNTETQSFEEGYYINCPNSWRSLKLRAAKIQDQITQIQNEWDSLKQAFSNTAKTANRKASLSTLKDIVIKTKDNTVQSASSSWQSLKSELGNSKQQILEMSARSDQLYTQALLENQNKIQNRTDISSLIMTGGDLTTITEQVLQINQFQELIRQKTNTYTTNQVISTHFDIGVQQLVNQSFLTPDIISQQYDIFKEANQDGLIKLTRHVYERQCRVNP